ncbi:hypothetical protein [Clostridium sp. YIM B02551]|uniref:hypothetical protein n=1 Tax=Clostridium sp. YIM B02551 TaxID=2910679 RepID=UPI001EEB5E91|nr:hypothetical protein [Clostridium sp. YIM B02551]
MIVCNKCKCNKCINNVDNPFVEEQKTACFNCDDCYYYDLKENKSKNIKFECDNFIISNSYAKADRKKLKCIR